MSESWPQTWVVARIRFADGMDQTIPGAGQMTPITQKLLDWMLTDNFASAAEFWREGTFNKRSGRICPPSSTISTTIRTTRWATRERRVGRCQRVPTAGRARSRARKTIFGEAIYDRPRHRFIGGSDLVSSPAVSRRWAVA